MEPGSASTTSRTGSAGKYPHGQHHCAQRQTDPAVPGTAARPRGQPTWPPGHPVVNAQRHRSAVRQRERSQARGPAGSTVAGLLVVSLSASCSPRPPARARTREPAQRADMPSVIGPRVSCDGRLQSVVARRCTLMTSAIRLSRTEGRGVDAKYNPRPAGPPRSGRGVGGSTRNGMAPRRARVTAPPERHLRAHLVRRSVATGRAWPCRGTRRTRRPTMAPPTVAVRPILTTWNLLV